MGFWSQISVVMIVLDAEEILPEALRSIPDAAEVVVADGGSRDRTVEVARQQGARVVAQDLASVEAAGGNFDVARNEAAAHAAREWILFLDADERLSPELVAEIDSLAGADEGNGGRWGAYHAYDMPRVNLFWGKPVRLLGEDRQLRFLRKGRGRYVGRALHQKMLADGTAGHLYSPLVHCNVRGWKDVARRFRRDIPILSRTYPVPPSRWKALMVPCHMFRHYYLRNQAWKDGARGLLVSGIYAVYHGAVAWAARREPHA